MRRILPAAIVLCSSFILIIALHSQCAPGLHAGIQGPMLPIKNGPYVLLSFLLLNDSDTEIAVKPESWKIVINGEELEDSGMIFDNGPMPAKELTPLQPGDAHALMKPFPMKKYFPHPGRYTIAWKGSGFVSSTITIIIPAS